MEVNAEDDNRDQDCPVCMDVMQDPVQIAACQHMFCKSCLMRSLENRSHCPICRGDINGDIRPATTGGAREQVRHRRSAGIRQTSNVQRPSLSSSTILQHLLEMSYSRRVQANASPLILPQHQAEPGADRGSLTAAPEPTTFPPLIPPSTADSSEEHMCEILEVMQFPENSSQSSQNSSEAVFSCPFCQEGGLDELDLVDHCNLHHSHDRTPVVCPVCTALPYGDPLYCSRNFIGHLNLRHCFYKEDFMDIHQGDAMNEQVALWESLKPAD